MRGDLKMRFFGGDSKRENREIRGAKPQICEKMSDFSRTKNEKLLGQ